MTEFYCGFIGFYRVLLFVFVVVVLCFNVLATDAAARRRRRHFLKRSRSDCFFERAAICGHRMVCFCFLFFVFVFFCIFFFFFIFFLLSSSSIRQRFLSVLFLLFYLFIFFLYSNRFRSRFSLMFLFRAICNPVQPIF